MEVSMNFKPSAVGSPMGQSYSPAMSSSTDSSSRKRAFSEVEDHNTPKSDTHKLHKHDEVDQENRDPLSYDGQKMDVDNPLSTATVPSGPPVDVKNSTQISNAEPEKSTLSSSTDMSSVNTTLTEFSHSVPSTPPRHSQQQQSPAASLGDLPMNKKQVLSPATKEAKRSEKEEKDRLKLEEKAKKEAEKRAKEEERKKKEAEREEEKKKREAEREEKRKLKEEEKQAKDEEKRKKDEEKEKKERSQMRLNAFFTKPTSISTKATKATNSTPSSPQKGLVQEIVEPTPSEKVQGSLHSDYRRDFPAFYLQSHTQMSSPHQFQRDDEALNHIRQKLDGYLKQPTSLPTYRGSELFNMIPYKRRKGRNIMSVKTIVTKAQTRDNSIDLTVSSTTLRNQLKKVAMKSLKFAEDVRPPYFGTFTKSITSTQAHKISRDPYARILPEVNYDYDSEAEWEEPEEGEDLDSEGEEDASEDGDDDMDGFLDDEEEEIDGRRRLIIGDQEPVCTGIKWQDGGNVDSDMEMYRIEALSDTIKFPIDPFSTAYWPKPKGMEQTISKVASSSGPIRATLHAYSTNSTTHTSSPLVPSTRQVTAADSAVTVKGKKPFPPEHMAEFKEIVEGCDLTKAGLIEVLKKRFPKVSKDTLKDTLIAVAVRVGQKEADKKWTCK